MSPLLKQLLKSVLGRGVRKSYGQFGEDAFIQAALKERTGFYIDIGAYHPILYSNTYALYKRGWRGIAVDPNPSMAGLFRTMRPRDAFVNAAIGEDGTGAYHRFSDGAYNTLGTQEAEIRRTMSYLTYLGSVDVPQLSLASLCRDHNVQSIDLLNIDVEGVDLMVLKSHDWVIFPRLIAIEDHSFDSANPSASETFRYLIDKGYKLESYCGLTLIFMRA